MSKNYNNKKKEAEAATEEVVKLNIKNIEIPRSKHQHMQRIIEDSKMDQTWYAEYCIENITKCHMDDGETKILDWTGE